MSPGRRDTALVRRRLLALATGLRQLRQHTGQPKARLRDDLDERWVVERGLQVCVQSCLDIATHLVASAGLDVPDYASAIDRLVTLGALDAEFVARFRGVAGFRNVLVHAYLDVDIDLLHELLNQRLDDFVAFAEAIDAHLGSPGDQGAGPAR